MNANKCKSGKRYALDQKPGHSEIETAMNNEEASQEFSLFLIDKKMTNCWTCGRPIKPGDVVWKDAATIEGERFTIAAIKCAGCDMGIASWASWHADV